MMKQVNSAKTAIFFLTLAFLALLTHSQAPSAPITISPGKSATYTNDPNTYSNFTSSFNITKKLLAITVDPILNTNNTLFLSLKDTLRNLTFTQFPNNQQFLQKCQQIGLNTCILRLEDSVGVASGRGVTVYFSVYASESMNYSILLELIDEVAVVVGQSQLLNFGKASAAVLKVVRGSATTDLTAVFTYNKIGGSFHAMAAVDQIPHSSTTTKQTAINSTSNGAYHQLMDLPAIGNASDYYILVQSQRGSTIEMKVYETESADLALNSSLLRLTNTADSFNVILTNDMTEMGTNGLRLRLNPYVGYGSFYVNYCDQFLEWQCGNTNGVICEVIISSADRTACVNQDSQNCTNCSFIIKSEVLIVSIENPLNFGYQISLYEQSTASSLLINQRLLAMLVPQKAQQIHPIDVPTPAYTYYINFTQDTTTPAQTIIFSVQECQLPKKNTNSTCTVIANSSTVSGQLSFIAKTGFNYSLHAHQQATSTISYELFYYYNQVNITELAPARKYLQQIGLRQYKFYRINLTSLQQSNAVVIDDIAQINITMQILNGKVDLLSSLTVPDPTLALYSSNSSQIRFQLGQTVTYLVNKTADVIYLSVYGQVSSLFNLDFTINGNVDLPIRYLLMKDGANSTFTLNKTKGYQLLSYSPHIRPYTITISGSPKCIRYGYSLPLSQTCAKRLPSQLLQQTLYLNISNGNSASNFNFSVSTSSGEYMLTYDNAIIIACNTPCYSIVNTTIEVPSRTIVKGKGEIHLVDNASQTNVKDALQLTCDVYPCMIQVNATVNFGGSISVYLEQSEISYLNDSTLPFSPSQLPKSFIFPIKSVDDLNDLVVRADGATIAASYSILTLDSQLDNIKSINFTALTLNDNTYYFQDTLRNIFILPIAANELNRLGCSLGSTLCFAAITIYLNIDVPTSTRFMNKGWASASSNRNPVTQLQLNSPLSFNDTLRINHLQYTLPTTITDTVRLDIEPISTCHPVVVDPSSTNQYIYGPIIYSKPTQAITVSVLSKGPCVYNVALTNSPYRTVYPNRQYTLDTNQGEVVITLLFSFDGTPSFTITAEPEASYKINAILVNQMQNSYDPIIVPSLLSSSFSSTNSNTLTVSQQKYYRVYSIKIITASPTISLIVQNKDTTFLSHDTTFSHTLEVGAKKSFLILSRRIINLQVESPSGKIQLNVSESDGSTPFSTTVINAQTRIIAIADNKVENQVVSYGVTMNNVDKIPLDFSILYSESVQYISQVYQRVVRYDSFTSPDLQNCYNYQAPVQFGRDKVVVDLVLDGQKYQNCSCIDLDYKIYLKSTNENKVQSLIRPTLTKLPTLPNAYRLEMTFIAGQTYTMCFSTPNRSAINKEYYLLVNSPIMKHLIDEETTIKYLPMTLDTFQIIEEGVNQNVMFELTLCDPQSTNDKTLTGTSYFSDYMFGTYSDLTDYHKNSESVFAMLNIAKGHFFFGVKNQQILQGAYSMRYSSIGQDNRLLTTAWDLRSKEIVDIAYDKSGRIVISLPKLVSLTDTGNQNNINLTYVLYVIDTTTATAANSSQSSMASILARCPGYNFSKSNSPFLKQQTQPSLFNKTISYTFSNLDQLQNADHQVQLKFDPSQLPAKFNITGRANVQANSQAFSYYYNTKPVELAQIQNDSGGSHSSAIAISIILLIIIVAVLGFIWYRRSRKQDNVDFELANFTSTSPTREKNEGLILTPKIEEKGYREMNDEIK